MEDGPPRFPRSFTCSAVLRNRQCHYSTSGTRLSLSLAKLPSLFPYLIMDHLMTALQPRTVETARFGLIPFRSPLLWESRLISTPPATEMFHFTGFALQDLCIQSSSNRTLLLLGFPIRKSTGQSLFGDSPPHIAAYHVLHRFLAPRHPPSALNILTINHKSHSLFNCQRSIRGDSHRWVIRPLHLVGGGERN